MNNIETSEKKGRERDGKIVGKIEIPFTNTAIDKLKIKGELDKGQYIKIRFKDQRGVHLYWSPRTSVKKFRLRIKFNHKDINLDLGVYLKGTYGCDEVLSKLSEIYKKHRKNGKWETNPKEEEVSTDELIESQKLTIRKVIEKLFEYNFPHKNIEGRLATSDFDHGSQIIAPNTVGFSRSFIAKQTIISKSEGISFLKLNDCK